MGRLHVCGTRVESLSALDLSCSALGISVLTEPLSSWCFLLVMSERANPIGDDDNVVDEDGEEVEEDLGDKLQRLYEARNELFINLRAIDQSLAELGYSVDPQDVKVNFSMHDQKMIEYRDDMI